jgi:exodeoxyribonuclease VII large subunit
MLSSSSILTVSELTRRIKSVVEADFNGVAIQGQISNFKCHSSGHLYFTIKDDSSQIRAVMWRGRTTSLFFTPQDGMKVVARGNVTVYEVRGEYQLDVQTLQPLGVGELQIAFDQLKRKLHAEGLFDADHKKPLPEFPERIGIVTSPTGAALRDMINVISRRCPMVELILAPVKVQGNGAAEEISAAVRDLNDIGGIDVLIVGRGGGSLEDLWAFNEECVARAIYASRIPVVSAVGHEVDFTIADFVADLRAPTPSAAAELVVRERAELVEIVRNYCYTAQQIIEDRIESGRERMISLIRSYSFNRPIDIVRQSSQRLDEMKQALRRITLHNVAIAKQHVTSLQKRMNSVNPDTVLERGYAMVLLDGVVISRASALKRDNDVTMKFSDGVVPARVK